MYIDTQSEQKCCFPWCCLGTIDPFKLVLMTLCWDLFLLFAWFVLNLFRVNLIGYGPLIINFLYIVGMFFIMWNLRDRTGKFSVIKYYSYFRVGAATFMSFFALSMGIMSLVFTYMPQIENIYIDRQWAFGFFLFFVPASFIHWGSVVGVRKALKLLKSLPITELNSQKRVNDGMYGTVIANPKTQFRV